ncbi:CoA pyrophosphatase [Palleronia caenipelagi]|uniref:CoA pyrophosphatase n=1 Tax=Palleronia caenipelagi TaxID=2489174 RepID=A0A547Q2G9_9RHOB|nr:CoA pyrophosphatase [Palleronia caenipelagi]TRD20583.1 CoA pyrophosphatase [Palleronia caenipelagi]
MTADLETRLRDALSRDGASSSDFDLNRDRPRPSTSLRGAAVLVAVRPDGRVLLTKRASHLSKHPGQIAFPGGKIDAGDADATAAALREAEEETGVPPQALNVLGALPTHVTVTGYKVTPIVAMLHWDGTFRPEPGEVAEIFEVPLAHLENRRNFRIEGRDWSGTTRYYYVVPWGPYYIWGATARILRGLAERLA